MTFSFGLHGHTRPPCKNKKPGARPGHSTRDARAPQGVLRHPQMTIACRIAKQKARRGAGLRANSSRMLVCTRSPLHGLPVRSCIVRSCIFRSRTRCCALRYGRNTCSVSGSRSHPVARAPAPEIAALLRHETREHHVVHFRGAVDEARLAGVAVDPFENGILRVAARTVEL